MPLITQGRESIADPEFDARERNYKVEIAKRLQSVIGLAASGGDWVAAWRSAIGGAYDGIGYNLTNWRQHQWFDQWVKADPDARAAVAAFGDRDADPLERFAVFSRAATQAEERELARRDPASALTLGSLFNFGIDYATVPLIRVRVFDEAMNKVGYARYRGSDAISRYRHYLEFGHAARSALEEAQVEIRDMLDVQSIVFELTYESESADEREPEGESQPRWFWVNQGQTWKAELAEGILWAPLLSKIGQKQRHWERMDELRPGDMVIHYSGAIRAVSRVASAASLEPKPAALQSDAWERDGRLVRSAYAELTQAIPLNEIPPTWRTDETGGPFTSAGSVQQGYLFSVSNAFVAKLLGRFEELRDAAGSSAPADSLGHEPDLEEVFNAFRAAVSESDLLVPAGRIRALVAALAAKPFAILSGLSGSGKTQLAVRLGEWFGEASCDRSLVVAVRPDWTGPESLFGYEDALRPLSSDGRAAWHVPDTLAFMLGAVVDPEHPYLLLLDEMNLAHVERYFSDFLSGVESGKAILPNLGLEDGEWRVCVDGPSRLELPANLFVVGTVNVDETTYLFSPKVLDRAFTFEVRTTTDELRADLKKPAPVPAADPPLLKSYARIAQDSSWHLEHPHPQRAALAESLTNLHAVLTMSGDEFGHRVLYESLRFAAMLAATGDVEMDSALDQVVLLKVLPRIHGSRRRVEPVLTRLARYTENPRASSAELNEDTAIAESVALKGARLKIDRMMEVLKANQFVSFSE